MRQDVDMNFFPWILGVGLLAAGAFGAVLIMAPPAARPPSVVSAALPAIPSTPLLPPPAAPAPLPDSVQALPPAQPPAVVAALTGNQIWQCEVRGQKVFADSPCGEGATLRALNDINRMASVPITSHRTYAPVYEPAYEEPYPEVVQSMPGTVVYLSRPTYGRALPRRPRPNPPRDAKPYHGPRAAHGV